MCGNNGCVGGERTDIFNSFYQSEELNNFYKNAKLFDKELIDVDIDIVEAINDHFWELI